MANYNKYEVSKLKLKNALDRIRDLFDVREFDNRVLNIQEEIDNLKNSKVEVDIEYSEYASSLDEMLKSINFEYFPYYNIYLLTEDVNKIINSMNEENYINIKSHVINLIEAVEDIEEATEKEKSSEQKSVLDAAYKAIYQALLYEETIDKDRILSYVMINTDQIVNENIGLLIKEDIKKLPQEEIVDIELCQLRSDLGHNYISLDIIKRLSRFLLGNKFNEYQNRKRTATMSFLESVDKLKKDNAKIATDKKENHKEIRKLRFDLAAKRLKFTTYVLLPVMFVAGTTYIGTKISRKYKIKTNSYVLETNKIIENNEEYEEHAYDHEINVMWYGPWQEKSDGNGYIRHIIEARFTSNGEPIDIDIKKTVDEIKNNPNYSNVNISTEEKSKLDLGDNTTEGETIITERVKDLSDSVTNEASCIALGICGILLLLLAEALVMLDNVEYFSILKGKWNDIKIGRSDLKNVLLGKITRKMVKTRYETIGDKKVELQEEYTELLGKYTDFGSNLSAQEEEIIKEYIKK